jgi:transposase
MRKIKLKMTRAQKEKLKTFADHARFTYNAAIDRINEDKRANKMNLRNQLVTYKNNPYFEGKEWLLETPKVIRQQAVFEATKNFKSAMTNLCRNNIEHFRLGFKTRKKKTWSLGIERAVKKVDTTSNGDTRKRLLSILPETLGQCGYFGKLPFDDKVTADSSIQKDGRGRYFLAVPIVRTKKNRAGADCPPPAPKPICALDPGVRKFLTGFSSDNSAFILGEGFGKRLLAMLRAVDAIDSDMSKANSLLKKKLRKKKMAMLGRIKDIRDEFQWKVINYLTTEFSCIMLPHLETQPLSQQRSRAKSANREMMVLGHYQFLQRLKHKCAERQVVFMPVSEHYTSKTCGQCGILNDVGSSETYRCRACHFCSDRDVQASRNIFIKTIVTESCLHFC